MDILLGLSAATVVCLFFILVVSLAFANSVNALRLLIYVFTLFAVGVTVYWLFVLSDYKQLPSSLMVYEVLNWLLLPSAIITLVSSVSLFFINYQKYRLGYLLIGTVFLLLALFDVFLSGQYLRAALDWQPVAE